eukprot:618889-Prorocentrum_minimum.AAC.1
MSAGDRDLGRHRQHHETVRNSAMGRHPSARNRHALLRERHRRRPGRDPIEGDGVCLGVLARTHGRGGGRGVGEPHRDRGGRRVEGGVPASGQPPAQPSQVRNPA